MLGPDAVAPITSVTPTSIFGWGGFVFGLGAFVILLWDRITGRTRNIATVESKIDGLCDQIDDLEGRLSIVDGLSESVRELTQEWRGVEGDNGYRSIIRKNSERIEAIERRNYKIDAVREEELRRGGGQQRRHMDRELNNLMPEEREDKP